MPILDVRKIVKTYTTRFGGNKVRALTGISFEVEEGEFVAIMGESGSGKTTLLNIIATLNKPTSGDVVIAGTSVGSISEKAIAAYRRDNLGFVFQDFNLLDTFSVKDNILLPLVLAGKQYKELGERLTPITQRLGISNILSKFPYEISGGEKQRTAVARALITNPSLILADEPTGALDSKSSGDLLHMFEEINKQGQTIVMVTHSVGAASHAGRVLFLRDGQIFHQIYRGGMSDNEMHRKISDSLVILTSRGERHE